MKHFKQLLAYTLIFAVTSTLADDDADENAFVEKIANILRTVEEKKDGEFCCTPLNQIITKGNITTPACKDGKNVCERRTCELQHSGIIVNSVIDEGKCKEQLDEHSANNPDMKSMVDAMKEGCLDGIYTKFTGFDCPALQLYTCFYLLGSIACPENSCDQSPVCKRTCDKFQQIMSLPLN